MRHLRFLLALSVLLTATAAGAATKLDIPAIDGATRSKGAWIDAEKVYKLTFPRNDVRVTVAGVAQPSLASWASFKSGNQFPAIMAGEIVLRQDEVQPAVSAAVESGLEVTALTARFAGEEPRLTFMHVGGEGTAQHLAAGVRKVLDTIKPASSPAPPPPPREPSAITAKALDAIFGVSGATADGGYSLVAGREVSMPCACKAGASMGVNTSAAFYGSDAKALVVGQFACQYGELQPVLRSLRQHGFTVTAVTNHLEAEAPRLIFVHYQSAGRAADLAKAVKATLDAQKERPQGAHDGHGAHGHHQH